MTLHDHVKTFTEHLEAKSYSPRTVEAYRRHTGEFVGYLEKYYPRISRPNEITREIVDDFQHFIREARTRDDRPPANTTVRLKLNALKSFFSFLVDRDVVLRDPTTVIVAPKEEQRLTRRVPTPDEMIEILRSVEPRDAASMRDRAILELLYASGMRTSELCNLKISEVDLKDQTAPIVRGKGGKTSIVPIGQYAAHYIELYLKDGRRDCCVESGKIPATCFSRRSGHRSTGRRSTGQCSTGSTGTSMARSASPATAFGMPAQQVSSPTVSTSPTSLSSSGTSHSRLRSGI